MFPKEKQFHQVHLIPSIHALHTAWVSNPEFFLSLHPRLSFLHPHLLFALSGPALLHNLYVIFPRSPLCPPEHLTLSMVQEHLQSVAESGVS